MFCGDRFSGSATEQRVGIDLADVFNGPSRLVFHQLIFFVFTGADGQDPRSDRLRARDIERGIANDHNFVPGESPFEDRFAPLFGNRRDAIAVFMIIGEGAGFEMVPELVVAEFEFGTAPDVAGEEAEDWAIRGGVEGLEEVDDAFADSAARGLEKLLEETRVVLEEAVDVGLGSFDIVLEETFAHQGAIGAAGELQGAGGGGETEDLGKGLLESFHARASAADEGSINIEEDESYHGEKKLTLLERRARIFCRKGFLRCQFLDCRRWEIQCGWNFWGGSR